MNALNPFSGPFVLDPAELPPGSVWVLDKAWYRTYYVVGFGVFPVLTEFKPGFWDAAVLRRFLGGES